jgi:hypothetical protein
MVNEIAENRNSNSFPTLPATGLPQRASSTDVARLLARCLANYGERRGADMRLMAAEWHASLGAHPAERLNAALTEHIRRSTYWPTVANLVDIMREQMPPPGLPRHLQLEQDFCRDGRTEAEEMAHRAAQVLSWKADIGFQKVVDGGEAPSASAAPASQFPGVSEALKASVAAQRAISQQNCRTKP